MAIEATYLQTGNVIEYTPSSAVSAGDVVELGDLVGVAQSDIAANVAGSLIVEGVVEFPKNTSTDIAVGVACYWDDSASEITTTSTGNKLAGFAVKAAATAAATVKVKLAHGVVASGS